MLWRIPAGKRTGSYFFRTSIIKTFFVEAQGAFRGVAYVPFFQERDQRRSAPESNACAQSQEGGASAKAKAALSIMASVIEQGI
jgi:hypothetical protein